VENNMYFFRRLYKEITLLNLTLFVIILVLSGVALMSVSNVNVKVTPHSGKAKAVTQNADTPSSFVQAPSLSDYAVITENNIFHPERKAPKEEKYQPKPELVLYGTIVSDALSVAYIEDKKAPQTSPGRGKRQIVVKQGDTISGFVLKEIHTDRIVLMRGDETMVVYLSDMEKQRGTDTTLSSKSATSQPPLLPGASPGSKPVTPPKPSVPPPSSPLPTPAPAPTKQTPPPSPGRGIGR